MFVTVAVSWLAACGGVVHQVGSPAPDVSLLSDTAATVASAMPMPSSAPIATAAPATAPVATAAPATAPPATSTPTLIVTDATLDALTSVATIPKTVVPDIASLSSTVTPRCGAPADFWAVIRVAPQSTDALDLASLGSDYTTVVNRAVEGGDFAGYELTADEPVKLIVWMRGDLATNTTELRRLVRHPDRLVVLAAKYSRSQIDAVVSEVAAGAQAHPQDVIGYSTAAAEPKQVVDVYLSPGDEAFAQQFVDRLGDAIRVHVGEVVYVGPGCGDPEASRTCSDLVDVDAAASGLTLTLTATTSMIEQRQTGEATLTIANNGANQFHTSFSLPAVTGVLVASGSRHVVGVTRTQPGLGSGTIDLAPGQSASNVKVVFATRRCDGGVGSAVPPGTYGLRVALTSYGVTGPTSYVSPEITVTVTANSNEP